MKSRLIIALLASVAVASVAQLPFQTALHTAVLSNSSGAASLLSGESNGVALDFTNILNTQRVTISTSGVETRSAPDDLLVDGNTIYPKRVYDATGTRIWSPHNFFFNSSSPATQTRTAGFMTGAQYTVSVTGSGSLALSGAGSGTVTEGSPVTFTAVSGSLTATKTGTLTTMQCNRGAVATAYLATGGISRFGVPVSYDSTLGESVLLVEPTRTNSFLNSGVPVTQSVSLGAATYVCWVEGSGSIDLSGGPTGTVTEGNPVSFTLGSTTSVTFTVTGTLTHVQVENGAIPTSQIITYAASVLRASDSITFPTSAIPTFSSDHSVYVDAYMPAITGTQNWWSVNDGTGANATNLRMNAASPQLVVLVSNVTQANPTGFGTITANTRQQFTARLKTDAVTGSLNATPAGISGTMDTSVTIPTLNTVAIGSIGGSGQPPGPFRVRRFVIVPRALGYTEVHGWRNSITTDPTAYDAFIIAGQSNTLNGFQIQAGDVTSASVDVISHSGTVSIASEPLPHFTSAVGRVGFGLAFARDYYVPNRLTSGRKVLLLPCGLTDTGFSDSHWGVDKDLYIGTLLLTGYVKAKFPGAVFKGVLWMQGEKDAQAAWTQSQYATALDATLTGFRTEIGNSTLPIVVGGMVPEWVAGDATRQPVADALVATPGRLANTGYADPSSPTVIPGRVGDTIHYDAAGQRGTPPGGMAGRFWTAWSAISP